jgi:hypothetical protein
MIWKVRLHDEFQDEFTGLAEPLRNEILALMMRLRDRGPKLGRPHAGTLRSVQHANLKELRFKVRGGVWRVTYAFDPEREAVLLAAGNKAGMSQTQFYKQLIRKSEQRYNDHLAALKRRRVGDGKNTRRAIG